MKLAGWVLGIAVVVGCSSSESSNSGGDADGTGGTSGAGNVAGAGVAAGASSGTSHGGSGGEPSGKTNGGVPAAGNGDGGDGGDTASGGSTATGGTELGGSSGSGGNGGANGGSAGNGGANGGNGGANGGSVGNGGTSGQAGAAGTGGSSNGGSGGSNNGGSGGTSGNECPEGSTGANCAACVVYVNQSGGSDAAVGTTWASAKSTLQAGVEAAFAHAPVCQVWVAKGSYVPAYKADPFAASSTATLQLRAGVALFGGFNGTEHSLAARNIELNVTTISGEIGAAANTDNLWQVVTGADGAKLDGFTITRAFGHAIECTAGTFSLDHCTVTDNQGTTEGGGLHVQGTCAATVSNSIFSNNHVIHVEDARGGAIYAEHGSLVVDGCTFSSNTAISGSGGGILSFVATHVSNSTFEGNVASNTGGGLDFIGPSGLVENCIFQGNQASYGAGLAADTAITVRGSTFTGNKGRSSGAIESRDITLEDSTISGNSAMNDAGASSSHGGGLYAKAGVVHIKRSHFSDNLASASNTSNGGAFACQGSCSATLFDVTFHNNTAVGSGPQTYGHGGAIAFNGVSLTLADCQFTTNHSLINGGAIYNYANASGFVFAYNNTFYGNTSSKGSGGAIYNNNGTVTLLNSIFWANTAAVEGNQVYNNTGVTSAVRGCDVQGSGFSGANGNIDQEPLFQSTLAGALDLRLQAGSPCSDKGANADLPLDVLDLDDDANTSEQLPFDIDGSARVQGASVDMGAHETPP